MVAFTACDPLEDTYNQLDVENPKTATADVTVTLTNTYASETAATAAIPALIDKSYPQLGNGSSAAVTYNLTTYSFNNNLVADKFTYTLTDADYALGGTNFKNFDRWSQVEAFLKAKYTSPKEGDLVTLTFAWYNSNVSSSATTITDSYYYKGGQWNDTYHVSATDYQSVDRGRFNNFVAADQDILPEYFNRFLKAKTITANAGDIQYVSFANRPSSTTFQTVMAMVFDGNNWNKVSANIVTPTTLKFSKKNGTWVPDLTIKYTLIADNYVWIAENSTAGTADNRANLKSFKNFFQSGSPTDTRYWTNEQIKDGLAQLLKNLYPNAEVGQKYQLSYIVYKGSNTVVTTTFEKNASGNYVEANP